MSTQFEQPETTSLSTSEIIEEIDAQNEAELASTGHQQGDDPSLVIPEATICRAGQEAVSVVDNRPVEPAIERQYPLLLRTKTPKTMVAVMSTIKTLVDEATLEYSPEGMTIRVMDPSHIALIDMVWPNHAFEMFECEGSGKFGVRVDELVSILKDLEPKDMLEMSYNPDGDSMLQVKQQGSKVSVKTTDVSVNTTPLPKLHYNAKVGFNYQTFQKALKAIAKVSDDVTMKAKNGSVTFYGKGDSGEMEKRYEAGDIGLEAISVKEESEATFSLDYLKKCHDALAKLKEPVSIEYSSKMPLCMEYMIEKVGRLHFYLAPRVQD